MGTDSELTVTLSGSIFMPLIVPSHEWNDEELVSIQLNNSGITMALQRNGHEDNAVNACRHINLIAPGIADSECKAIGLKFKHVMADGGC